MKIPRIVPCVAILAVFLVGGEAAAVTLRVPTEHATITAAMVVASAGDTVLVAAGVYEDTETRTGSLGIGYVRTATAVVFMADGVVLLSEDGRDHTTIGFASPGGGLAAAILAGGFAESGTTIDGFEIAGTSSRTIGLWTTNGRDLVVRNCRFVDLGVDLGSGAGIHDIETPSR